MRQCKVTCIIRWYNVLDIQLDTKCELKTILFELQVKVAYISNEPPLVDEHAFPLADSVGSSAHVTMPLGPQSFMLHIRGKLIVLLDFSLTVKAATLIFISRCGSAILSAKEGNSGFIYNMIKS